jgi:hypothetical protein
VAVAATKLCARNLLALRGYCVGALCTGVAEKSLVAALFHISIWNLQAALLH